ncbi:30S ribosomal protein S13 [Venturia nashicola]|uniref:30S ribosomal protein S13 n=1 Tax=Venturia nashicola TaxID=86259 RepID=A0A4Z1PIE2_9PEZI|nr:30S ribosomal protein S13 [Venturia nashicola]
MPSAWQQVENNSTNVDVDVHYIAVFIPFLLTKSFPEVQLVKKALESFYGIGPLVSKKVMAKHCIHETSTLSALSNQKILDLTAEMTGMKLESDLKREVRGKILRLKDMGTYRGKRHAMGLPVRGQNTKSGQIHSARKMNRVEWKN